MFRMVRDPRSTDPAIVELRRQLERFYASTTNYSAFQATEPRDTFYSLLVPFLQSLTNGTPGSKPRVLELGAGRTGFPEFLRRNNLTASFTAQDVTAANEAYLRGQCDTVHIGDVKDLDGDFDLIVSTFVFEHVSSPREFLEQVKRLVAAGGAHVVACPRYDLPGYVCPSLRHLSRARQLMHSTLLTGSRLLSRLDRRPRFWVNTDPSLLHGPWYRDADAVHLVSRFDVEQWHRQNGFDIHRLRMPYQGIRGWLLQRQLTLNLLCRRRA